MFKTTRFESFFFWFVYVSLRENMNGNVPFYHFSNMGTFPNVLNCYVLRMLLKAR